MAFIIRNIIDFFSLSKTQNENILEFRFKYQNSLKKYLNLKCEENICHKITFISQYYRTVSGTDVCLRSRENIFM